MITAQVRLVADTPTSVAAFVLVGDEPEIRVRWSPGRWRCDQCGERPWPKCRHAIAVVNSPAYQIERDTP